MIEIYEEYAYELLFHRIFTLSENICHSLKEKENLLYQRMILHNRCEPANNPVTVF